MVWGNRLARVASIVAMAVLVTGALGVSTVYRAMFSSTCQEIEYVDLPIELVIDVKQRKEAYQLDPAGNQLALSGDELSFLVRGMYAFKIRIWFAEGQTRVMGAFPRDTGCYNVDAIGDLTIESGVLTFDADQLVVGEIDLATFGLGGPWRVTPEDVQQATLRDALANTRVGVVEREQIRLELFDPWRLPW